MKNMMREKKEDKEKAIEEDGKRRCWGKK